MIFRLVIAIGFFGIFFLLLQLGLSRTSPHKVEIFSDKVKFVGPWGFGKNTIHFHQISAIAYNENTFMISPKWPGFCNVTIRPSLDPEKEIRKELFNKLQGNPKIKFVKNNHL